MAAAGVTAADIDFLVVGTTTPDLVFPNVGCLVQRRLGIHGCPAFSVEAACSGFIYALSMADRFVASGMAKCALVIGAETLSRIVDWSDRGHLRAVRRRCRRRGAQAGGRTRHPVLPPRVPTATTVTCSTTPTARRGRNGLATRSGPTCR